jgi:alkylhydroperoxidase family enzyme
MSEVNIHELRASGWMDRDIHDATQVIAYFNYINRVADALGVNADEWLVEFEKELDG